MDASTRCRVLSDKARNESKLYTDQTATQVRQEFKEELKQFVDRLCFSEGQAARISALENSSRVNRIYFENPINESQINFPAQTSDHKPTVQNIRNEHPNILISTACPTSVLQSNIINHVDSNRVPLNFQNSILQPECLNM